MPPHPTLPYQNFCVFFLASPPQPAPYNTLFKGTIKHCSILIDICFSFGHGGWEGLRHNSFFSCDRKLAFYPTQNDIAISVRFVWNFFARPIHTFVVLCFLDCDSFSPGENSVFIVCTKLTYVRHATFKLYGLFISRCFLWYFFVSCLMLYVLMRRIQLAYHFVVKCVMISTYTTVSIVIFYSFNAATQTRSAHDHVSQFACSEAHTKPVARMRLLYYDEGLVFFMAFRSFPFCIPCAEFSLRLDALRRPLASLS